MDVDGSTGKTASYAISSGHVECVSARGWELAGGHRVVARECDITT